MAKVSITLPNRASIILETEDAGMVRDTLALLLQTPAAANGPPPPETEDAPPAAPETPADFVAPPTPQPASETPAAAAPETPPPLPPQPAANGNPADANTPGDAADANAAVAAYPGRRNRRRQAYRQMRARHRRAVIAPGVETPPLNGLADAAIPTPPPSVAVAPPPIPAPETPDNSANGLPPPVAPPAAPMDAAVVAAAPPPIPPGLGIPGTVIALEAGLPTPYDIPRESAAGLTALGDTAARLIQPATQVATTPPASDGVEATPPCARPVSEILTDAPTETAPPPPICAKSESIIVPDYTPVAPPPDAPPMDAVQTDEARPVAPPPAMPPADAIPPDEARPVAPPGNVVASDDVPPPDAAPVDAPPPLAYAPLVDELPPEDDMPDDAPSVDDMPDEAPPIDALPDDDMDDDEPYYAWNSNPNNAISVPASSVAAGNYAWASRVGAAAATPSMARRNPAYAPAPGLAPEPSAAAAAVDGAASGGLRLAEQPRPAREAFTAFCRSVNPLGDMRRVVVAAEGAARCFATDGVDADELGELFDLAGWRRPPNFTQTLRNAARSKFGWLERIPGRTGRYAPTNLGRTETIPTSQRR